MIVLLLFVQRLSEKLSFKNLQLPGSESDLQFLDNSGAKDPAGHSFVSVLGETEHPHLREMLRARELPVRWLRGRDVQAGSPGWWHKR